ncbi:UNVERIFIED_CONTAM: hypothetical protein O8I53_12265 [Campylobacter lari]
MLKILPTKIKAIFSVGAFLVLVYVMLNIFLPNIVGEYIRLIMDESGAPFSIKFFNGKIAFEA